LVCGVVACSDEDGPRPTPATGGENALGGEAGAAEAGTAGVAGIAGIAGVAGVAGALGGQGGDSAGGVGGEQTGGVGGEQTGGEAGQPSLPSTIPERDESDLEEPIDRAGFIELSPRTYVEPLLAPNGATTTATRMFYRFIAADEDAKNKPVLVFFNGGPGFTSMLLYTFGTGPLSLDADAPGAPPSKNEASFTSLGNLLYIDARHTGFSYGLTGDPSDADERASAFDAHSFAPGPDAADFVQVVLRVLAEQPALQNNRVVLVGESYGGLRASLMLNILLYESNPFLEDNSVKAERDAHYASVFAGVPSSLYGPDLFSLQFGWQVLIEPYVLSTYQEQQEGQLRVALEERMAAEHGVSVADLRSDYCYDDLRRLAAECDTIPDAISAALLEPTAFEAWMGVPPEAVPGLPAAQRQGAFRLREVPGTAPLDPPAFTARAGELPEWDRYFSPWAIGRVTSGRGFNRIDALPFLLATRYVHTLVTNAAFDATVMGEALVPALQALRVDWPWVLNAEYIDGTVDEPSERIHLEFGTQDLWPPAGESTIYFPRYANSGHAVTMTEGAKLRDDVGEFLSETFE
jgi:serine carboxypeptidase